MKLPEASFCPFCAAPAPRRVKVYTTENRDGCHRKMLGYRCLKCGMSFKFGRANLPNVCWKGHTIDKNNRAPFNNHGKTGWRCKLCLLELRAK